MMLKKINDFLAGVPMTAVGGISLVVSLCLTLTGHSIPVDPAWIAVVLCGIPLVYLSLWGALSIIPEFERFPLRC